MVSKRSTRGKGEGGNEESEAGSSGYEQFRELRIKENRERMQKLGIFDLSFKLRSSRSQPQPKKTPGARNVSSDQQPHHPLTLPASPRRSSRLKSLSPVNYSELENKTKRESSRNIVEIRLREGSKPEIYTEKHEKLLGDCKTAWTLFVDGYGKDGKRIYDPEKGESCHQCRQKTLGHHTHCSKCNLVQGQFCGDCLYMRYGENVIEVNRNPNWICPVCRGICNCSFCRHAKGWVPTGALYRKIIKLGFKSVAHYLIQTHRSQTHLEDSGAESLVSEEAALPSAYIESQPSSHNEYLNADERPDGFHDRLDDYEEEMEQEERQPLCSDSSKHVSVIDLCDDEIGAKTADSHNSSKEEEEHIGV